MKKLKNSRAITYRRPGIPALILEGKWLTDKYKLRIGDVVDIDYQPKEISFKKNQLLSKERQKHLEKKEELKRKRNNENHENQTGDQEAPQGQSAFHSG